MSNCGNFSSHVLHPRLWFAHPSLNKAVIRQRQKTLHGLDGSWALDEVLLKQFASQSSGMLLKEAWQDKLAGQSSKEKALTDSTQLLKDEGFKWAAPSIKGEIETAHNLWQGWSMKSRRGILHRLVHVHLEESRDEVLDTGGRNHPKHLTSSCPSLCTSPSRRHRETTGGSLEGGSDEALQETLGCCTSSGAQAE
eukprot:5099289-Amphidinium_carterae.5